MAHESGHSRSIWIATAEVPPRPPLTQDMRADVRVIGAGIAGLTTAYLLGHAGKTVIVLDDGPIGGGMTQLTTAHLANAIDNRFVALERLHGEKGARLAASSHTVAIDRIEAIVVAERMACEFEHLDGYLFGPPGQSSDVLHDELEAARRAGLNGVEMVARATGALRYRPLPAFSPTSAVPSAEIPRRACRRHHARRRAHLHPNPCDRDPRRHTRARPDGSWTCGYLWGHRGRDQYADSQPRHHPHQAGALYHLCRRGAAPARRDDTGPLLGYPGSLPLRAAAEDAVGTGRRV